MKWIGFLVAFVLMAVSTPSHAQDMPAVSARQLEIMRLVVASNGTITQALHDEFWALMPPVPEKDKADFQQFVKQATLATTEFQKEVWTSIKLSGQKGVPVKSDGYDAARAQAIRILGQYSAGDANRQGLNRVDSMIEAAANRVPFDTPNGPVNLTPELASQVLDGLEGSISRARNLLDPDWKE